MNNYTFYVDDNANELKQHVNLSENAWLVIREDIKTFYDSESKESFSGFLNRVFKNFYQRADASIYLRYMEKADELEKLYSSKEFATFDKGTIKKFIDKYAEVYENELIAKSRSYPSGHGEKFRINKENIAILRNVEEANYYENSIGLYLKAIFEEYVTKPQYIREQIFFADTLSEINKAIKDERKLKIALVQKITQSGEKRPRKKYYVSCYKIVQDKTNSFNYLIGFAEEIKEMDDPEHEGVRTISIGEKSAVGFRISRIEKANVMSSMGAHISKERANELEKDLVERTAMYMPGNPIDIKVVFTDKGLEDFRTQLLMRPQFYKIDKEDKHVYLFRCTEVQAINYFFKMGSHATIVEPASLYEKFMKRYESGFKSYQEKKKIAYPDGNSDENE